MRIVLEGVANNSSLISLIIQSNEMNHTVVDELTKTIARSNLHYLDISHNNIGNDGLAKFCRVLQHSK